MDCELVRRARDGDREAFAEIVEASFDRYFEIARRVIGESQLAQDATQQALLSVWRDLPRLRDVARFDAWSYRIVVNACYAEIRNAKRSLPDLGELGLEALSGDDIGPVAERDQLERAFAQQKADHRAVLVLRYYLDMTVDEIAEALEIPAGTVKSRIHHALKSMRSVLDADARYASGTSPDATEAYPDPVRRVLQ